MSESIVIENLSKYYNMFLVVDNLSLKIGENENVGLLGPNGAAFYLPFIRSCLSINLASVAEHSQGTVKQIIKREIDFRLPF